MSFRVFRGQTVCGGALMLRNTGLPTEHTEYTEESDGLKFKIQLSTTDCFTSKWAKVPEFGGRWYSQGTRLNGVFFVPSCAFLWPMIALFDRP